MVAEKYNELGHNVFHTHFVDCKGCPLWWTHLLSQICEEKKVDNARMVEEACMVLGSQFDEVFKYTKLRDQHVAGRGCIIAPKWREMRHDFITTDIV